MRSILPSALVLSALLAAPGAAFAQSISQEEALERARAAGMATIEEVERDDGHWEIEGRDAGGRELELRIDGRTGHVTDRDD